MKFLDFTRTFQNLQALATRLLQTIGSKRVANAQTMENNGSIVASAFAFKIENFRTFRNCHKMISRLSNIMKSRLNRKLQNFVQNEFEVCQPSLNRGIFDT